MSFLFLEFDFVGEKVFSSGAAEVHQNQGSSNVFGGAYERPLSGERNSCSLGSDGINRSYSVSGLHLCYLQLRRAPTTASRQAAITSQSIGPQFLHSHRTP